MSQQASRLLEQALQTHPGLVQAHVNMGVVLLTGLGVRELSVSIPSIAAVKAQVRGLSMTSARDLAQRAARRKVDGHDLALPLQVAVQVTADVAAGQLGQRVETRAFGRPVQEAALFAQLVGGGETAQGHDPAAGRDHGVHARHEVMVS